MSILRTGVIGKVAAIVFSILLMEGFAFAFWEYRGSQRIASHERVDLESTVLGREFETWRSSHTTPDKELGWTNNKAHKEVAPDGSRRDQGPHSGINISVYGASFVYGAGVANQEAFPSQLAVRLQNQVRNFGVGSYGPDQAVLRLERHLASGQRPEIVILGMASESLARVTNIYRKLYIPVEIASFVKPMFAFKSGHWQNINAVPSWPPSVDARKKLIAVVKKHDGWYGQNQLRLNSSFPYILTTIRAAKFFLFDVVRWQDLYDDKRAISTLEYVLERFIGLSKKYGFRPFFVIFPNPEDLMRLQVGEDAYYTAFEDSIARKYSKDMVTVPVLAEAFDVERFNIRPLSGHPSAYGHKIIASAIYKKIRPFVGTEAQ